MTEPGLVVVPAHPRAGDMCRVEFEVRRRTGGQAALPVFSTVAALVRALGRYQPWVCVPLRAAREAAGRAGLEVVLDPGVSPGSPRWTAPALEASGGETGPA